MRLLVKTNNIPVIYFEGEVVHSLLNNLKKGNAIKKVKKSDEYKYDAVFQVTKDVIQKFPKPFDIAQMYLWKTIQLFA